MATNYEDYRQTKIKSGLLFQDFVVDLCWQTIGLAIVQYVSEQYQNKVGESRTGVEIKHDEKVSKTGNLWIEVAEKARPRNGNYAPSGIYRDDNTWLYIIGDYSTVYIFGKRILRAICDSRKFPVIENNTKTSRGFLLPIGSAAQYASVVLRPNATERVSKFVCDLANLGRELHAAVRANPAQCVLFNHQSE